MSGSRRHPNVRAYLLVFAVLMFLTAVTVLVSYWRLPKLPAIGLGLMIAAAKASLVAAFFMHLKGERRLICAFLGLTLLFTAFLFLLPVLDSVGTAGVRLQEPAAPEAGSEHVP